MFTKATKSQSKLRAALYGPSGGGKTYTALRIATGIILAGRSAHGTSEGVNLSGKIAVIDSERGSAAKYADKFEFDACNLADKSVEGYIAAIKFAGNHGYGVLIIDSLSHAWADLLMEVEKIANARYKGNTWSAWSEGTPRQQELIDAILDYPGHIIATMRAKTEWTQVERSNGKKAPERVGLAPQQGKGIEYEFDLLLSIGTDHLCTVEKDRSGKFQGQIIDKPGEDFGRELAAWLGQGAPIKSIVEQLNESLGEHEAACNAFFLKVGWLKDGQTFRDISPEQARQVLARPSDVIAKALQ